jgi:hypothetical protein
LVNAGHVTDALAEIIKGYIDPRSNGARATAKVEVKRLGSLNTDAVVAAVNTWLGLDGRALQNGST